MPKIAKWTGFVVDVEADGPIPGDYSMIEIGVVKLDRALDKTFHATVAPISMYYSEDAMRSIGTSRKEILSSERGDPVSIMGALQKWVLKTQNIGTRPMFFSDNNGFDWMFYKWYIEHAGIPCPFGHTSRNIADLFRGLQKDVTANFKKLRDTKHTHNPVDDAIGNAEALIKFVDQYGLEGLNIGD